jgi:hypothetical protein
VERHVVVKKKEREKMERMAGDEHVSGILDGSNCAAGSGSSNNKHPSFGGAWRLRRVHHIIFTDLELVYICWHGCTKQFQEQAGVKIVIFVNTILLQNHNLSNKQISKQAGRQTLPIKPSTGLLDKGNYARQPQLKQCH